MDEVVQQLKFAARLYISMIQVLPQYILCDEKMHSTLQMEKQYYFRGNQWTSQMKPMRLVLKQAQLLRRIGDTSQ
ncbi:unnamed protein product [Paramecium primaurelia]|uniref:Uncharacterized protein n=1 Tax=Paramecium primaurelia TaxID=5886 RepID=A0A8S1QBF3_PARPR|nr:unnamed protein product [Paramecium primaurelia]